MYCLIFLFIFEAGTFAPKIVRSPSNLPGVASSFNIYFSICSGSRLMSFVIFLKLIRIVLFPSMWPLMFSILNLSVFVIVSGSSFSAFSKSSS